MTNDIKCPNCGHIFDVENVIAADLEKKFQNEYHNKLQESLNKIEQNEKKFEAEKLLFEEKKSLETGIHKKGKRIIESVKTNTSKPAIKAANCKTAPSLKTSAKPDLLRRINNSNCGKITGNPKIAINAAFCCALEAMALINVKVRLMLVPPNKTIP